MAFVSTYLLKWNNCTVRGELARLAISLIVLERDWPFEKESIKKSKGINQERSAHGSGVTRHTVRFCFTECFPYVFFLTGRGE